MKLTTNNPASSHGQPVLEHMGNIYGPGDRIPSIDHVTAAGLFKRYLTANLVTDKMGGRELAIQFVNLGRLAGVEIDPPMEEYREEFDI